jgi:hypothetical protein
LIAYCEVRKVKCLFWERNRLKTKPFYTLGVQSP